MSPLSSYASLSDQLQPAMILCDWYEVAARDLPWRTWHDCSFIVNKPWAIMVSEFMLQQTPVKRVLPYWYTWLQRWETPASLAKESISEAVRAWDRLGYPRRAQRLHRSATVIAHQWNNHVPHQVEDLLTLPGVGEYTAAAIAHFAYGAPVPVVDVNICRVINRVWKGCDNSQPRSHERTFLLKLMIDFQHISTRSLPSALMEFGALVCTAHNPRCDSCPIQAHCNWFHLGKPASAQERKSQGYAGTDRYVRGLILQLLRRNHTLDFVDTQCIESLWEDPIQRNRAIDSLLHDQLIERNDQGCYRLAT